MDEIQEEKFQWIPEYETGIEIIDEQHRDLFRRFDKFVLAVYRGTAIKQLDEIMEFLEEYIDVHFETEEALMVRFSYTHYRHHRDEHFRFKTEFEKLKKSLGKRGGDSYLAIAVERLLTSWWKNHILNTDMKYVPEMAEQYNREKKS